MNTSSEAADLPAKPDKGLSIALLASLPLAVLLKMGFFFLIIGMLPTLLTLAMTRQRKAQIISTVAAFNFAGVFPDLLTIFLQGGTPRAVLDRLSEVSVWGFMYGAAALGLAIVWLSPAIAMMILESLYRGRMRHMETLQKKLEEEWGLNITGREE